MGRRDNIQRQTFVDAEIHEPVIHEVEHTKAIYNICADIDVNAPWVFPLRDAKDSIWVHRLNTACTSVMARCIFSSPVMDFIVLLPAS